MIVLNSLTLAVGGLFLMVLLASPLSPNPYRCLQAMAALLNMFFLSGVQVIVSLVSLLWQRLVPQRLTWLLLASFAVVALNLVLGFSIPISCTMFR